MITVRSGLLILGLVCPAVINAGTSDQIKTAGKFILQKTDSVCATLQKRLATVDAQPYSEDTEGVPDWKETDVVLPEELKPAMEADFDFYNDGHIDSVFLSIYSQHVMQGSSLLVQPGSSPSSLKVAFPNPLDDPETRFYPCQLADKNFSVKECSDGDHNNDSFAVYRSSKSRAVEFPVNFSELNVVRIQGETFVVALGMLSVAPGVAAVFRPNRDKELDLVCMLQRGPIP